MIINYINEQDALLINEASVKRVVQAVLQEEGRTCDEVTIYFVDTKTICELHAHFFDDPSPTDCISFPMDEEPELGYLILGDVFVCPQTAIEYAAKHQMDAFDEVILYIVHGLLHLLGYDDIEDADRVEMKEAEKRCMKKIKDLDIHLNHQ